MTNIISKRDSSSTIKVSLLYSETKPSAICLDSTMGSSGSFDNTFKKDILAPSSLGSYLTMTPVKLSGFISQGKSPFI